MSNKLTIRPQRADLVDKAVITWLNAMIEPMQSGKTKRAYEDCIIKFLEVVTEAMSTKETTD